ncbi:TetR/AcrR family transcriptional regulator [Streptantibioticus ferralitis]|uniref:TetR/AcrR family transcriptional regulator n=1 Tax=Streptantibioticus ferralitis TaxID=236510 RepID=A0ABT5Z8U8_9ACTN|nr:TetR/AcrR family transcriptional regulator [Streptantibioticus ferralitis]MDF2260260.1 TetR/AcrR family transcriptional regulator [Streptantibioticus ferralitis]
MTQIETDSHMDGRDTTVDTPGGADTTGGAAGDAKGTAKATRRPRRVTLSRESILDAALRLCSREGGAVLTFSRLGKELGADPTAVYRHFRDKDDLVLALTDVMIVEAVQRARAGAPPRQQWREWLLTTVRSIRSVYLERPALAVLAATRTTASPVESESVEEIIGVLHDAGLPVAQAAESCRALVDLTLAFTQYTAAFQILDEETQAKDDRAWAVKYATLPAARFPLVHASAARLTELFRNDDEVFELALATFLDGIEAKIQRARG